MQLTVKVLDNATEQLVRMARGCVALQNTTVKVGTRLPYGYGIEYGSHRLSGRLARAAGPALYLNRARAEILADGERDLAQGLKNVTAPGPWMLTRLGKWIRRLAKTYVPVGADGDPHPGRLRKSIVVVRSSGGGR